LPHPSPGGHAASPGPSAPAQAERGVGGYCAHSRALVAQREGHSRGILPRSSVRAEPVLAWRPGSPAVPPERRQVSDARVQRGHLPQRAKVAANWVLPLLPISSSLERAPWSPPQGDRHGPPPVSSSARSERCDPGRQRYRHSKDPAPAPFQPQYGPSRNQTP
jgi:hypothetical protein